jgi:hypothetical protein
MVSESGPTQRVRNFLDQDKTLISAALNGDRSVLIRALKLLNSVSYICPTCGRPQHPGEKCEPGHADDD